MPLLCLETLIRAPIARCFDLARDIDLHTKSTSQTREEAIAGVTSGRIGLGERVTWRATHFGIRQKLTVEITIFEPPTHFRDSMVQGAFRRFDHDHYFTAMSTGVTLMRDEFDYAAPLGPLGRLAERWFLNTYLEALLTKRNAVIKQAAESAE